MGVTTDPTWREEVHPDAGALSEPERLTVLRELEAILNSPAFQTSKRCQQFLSYVVKNRLEGNLDRLKERTIGVELFHRPAGYATGDDPVVRVQAGEVRRRLEKYYSASPGHAAVRIELHVGSYAPEFTWQSPSHEQQPSPDPSLLEETPGVLPTQEPLEHGSPVMVHPGPKRRALVWTLSAAGLFLLFTAILIVSTLSRAKAPKSTLEQFWSPALSTSQPVLICLAKPAVYLPSVKLYQRHSKTPDLFTSQFERLMRKPDLQPNEKIAW